MTPSADTEQLTPAAQGADRTPQACVTSDNIDGAPPVSAGVVITNVGTGALIVSSTQPPRCRAFSAEPKQCSREGMRRGRGRAVCRGRTPLAGRLGGCCTRPCKARQVAASTRCRSRLPSAAYDTACPAARSPSRQPGHSWWQNREVSMSRFAAPRGWSVRTRSKSTRVLILTDASQTRTLSR